MQDLIFWVLAGVSLLSLICAVAFASAYWHKPKKKKVDSDLLDVSEALFSSGFSVNTEQDIKDMELTVTKPLEQPDVSPIEFLYVPQQPAQPSTGPAGGAKTPSPVKPRKKSDMDAINELLEKLK